MSEIQFFQLASIAFAVSLLVSLLIVVSQKWHGGLSHDHDLNGVQKVHTTAVPRIGGLGVLAGIVLGCLGFGYFFHGGKEPTVSTEMLLLLAASMPAFLAGLIEDFTKRVSVRVRLAATAMSALVASALLGATVTQLNIWGVDTLLQFMPVALLVTAIVVAGGSNAINIIDGFNGLSSGTIVIMSAGLAAVALRCGDHLVANLGMLAIGATLGFMMLNYPRGKLFLGDGGAYFLGFWVSEMAVLLLVRNSSVNAWQVLSICAYPVIEVLFSIYRRRFIQKVSPGAPDALHLHTLVYRRMVFKYVDKNSRNPWKRNAAVACIIPPVVAVCVAVSVLVGTSIAMSMLTVLAQVVLYIAVYGRLVRGRWTSGETDRIEASVSVNTKLR